MEYTSVQRRSFDTRAFLVKYGLAIVTVLIGVVFALMEPQFASPVNLLNILSSASILSISGIGVTLVLCFGEINFACGMELAVGAVIMGKLLDAQVVGSYVLAVVIALAFLVLVGGFNTFLHVKIGIPAFIATMGTSLLLKGFAKYLTGGASLFSKHWKSSFTFLGQGYLFGVIPIPVVVLLVVGSLLWVYSEYTTNGRYLYAVGSNAKTCEYVGIDIQKQKLKGFVLCAVLCGIGGIMQGSMLNNVSYTMGDGTLVSTVTAIMLGATFLRPGVYNIPGTLLGTFLVTMLSNGFVMIGLPNYAKSLIQGTIMLLAISFVTVIRKRPVKGITGS